VQLDTSYQVAPLPDEMSTERQKQSEKKSGSNPEAGSSRGNINKTRREFLNGEVEKFRNQFSS
jgi:hypothetical protein